MSSLVGILFILGCVGIWYFTKKYKNKKFRNYSIALAILCVLIIGINGEIQHHAQERQDELAIKVSDENDYYKEAHFNTNSTGTAIIKGKTLPNAKVTLVPDSIAKEEGFKKKSTKADSKGTFKFSVDLTVEQELESFTLEANSKGLDKESFDVSVFNDSKAYTDKQAAIEKQKEKEDAEREAKEKAEKEAESKAAEEAKKKDITVLSDDPTFEQKTILSDLAQQKFEQQYPYKGSKIHSILGVIQDWIQYDGEWFYKAEATINNAFGAERDTTIEIRIEPVSPNSGNVTIMDY